MSDSVVTINTDRPIVKRRTAGVVNNVVYAVEYEVNYIVDYAITRFCKLR